MGHPADQEKCEQRSQAFTRSSLLTAPEGKTNLGMKATGGRGGNRRPGIPTQATSAGIREEDRGDATSDTRKAK